MAKFKKKPVVIEAVQIKQVEYYPEKYYDNEMPFFSTPFSDQPVWLTEAVRTGELRPVKSTHSKYARWEVSTLEGQMLASPGDWIIRGVEGELYFCKESIFKLTYEEVKSPLGD